MGILNKFLGRKDTPQDAQPVGSYPRVVNEEIANTLNLGWYYSEEKDELQMAKVAGKDRATHLYVIGATGTGKTRFLEFLIQQDIENGNGFGVIDPHGDLIEDIKGILSWRYYESGDEEEISERVILVDPTDARATITFNPLEPVPGVSVSEQAAELVSVFKKIWSDSWGVRMEDLMRNSLIALGEVGLTLAHLPQFLTSRPFRQNILLKVTHPIAREYFSRFDTLTDRTQVTWVEPVMNKINAFLSDDRVRQMFSHRKSSFRLRDVMDQRKILLVNLNKGKLKDSSELLGSLLLAKIQMAAFSRSDISPARRTPFYLYIDEFQNFASDSFATVLSEARKYGLSLVMAHQTLSQIPDQLKGLILGNTGIQVYFRLNRQDAALLAKEIFEYSGFEVKTVHNTKPVFWSLGEEWERKIEWLQNQPQRTCYVKHKIAGGVIPIYTAKIAPPWERLGMTEEEHQEFLYGVPFGKRYLMSREDLLRLPAQAQHSETEPPTTAPESIEKRDEIRVRPVPKERVKQKPIKVLSQEEPQVEPTVTQPQIEPAITKPRDTSQHKYLKALIKRVAESRGYRAVIEQPTPDNQGKVDVSLEREGKRIACEVSWTSTPKQELHNIEKCLQAGYDMVILCSPEKRTLEKVETIVSEQLDQAEQTKVLFFQPEELFAYLETAAGSEPLKEERIKGYKVKVHYLPVDETERESRREAIARVLIQSLRHLEEKPAS